MGKFDWINVMRQYDMTMLGARTKQLTEQCDSKATVRRDVAM